MQYRSLLFAAVIPVLGLAACGNNTSPSDTATVRFINATTSNIDVSDAGTVASANRNLAFGGSSTCLDVNTTAASLAFSDATTAASIPGFTQGFMAGGNYTVVAYPGAATTGTQFLTVDNRFTPSNGQAGIQIVNAASGTGALIGSANGTTLGTGAGIEFGTGSGVLPISSGAQTITFNTGPGTSPVVSTAALNLAAGQNYTLIIAPPASGSTTLRTFLVPDCG